MMDPSCIFVITADRMNITCFSVLVDTVKPVAYYRSNRVNTDNEGPIECVRIKNDWI